MQANAGKFYRNKFLILISTGLLLLTLIGFGIYRYVKQQAEKPYIIGVILSQLEVPSGQMPLLKKLIRYRLQELNEQGGINGRPVALKYLEDQQNEKKLYELVKKTGRDPNLIAYVGCRGIARAKAIGPLITKEKIPLIGQYVFTHNTQNYPTMYTASIGTTDVKFLVQEVLREKATSIALIGESANITSRTVLEVVLESIAEEPDYKISVKRSFPKGYDFKAQKSGSFLDSLKNVDFLIVNSSTPNWHSLVAFLDRNKINVPILNLTSDFQQFDPAIPGYNATELFALNTFSIPGAQNTKLIENLSKFQLKPDQSFQGMLVFNLAARISDEIGLVQDASLDRSSKPGTGIRTRINNSLKKYINGDRVYRGWLTDWYFNSEHAYGGQALMAWKPKNSGNLVLAPFQFLGKDTSYQKGQVLYTNLNLESINQVVENEGTFYATFFLEINAAQKIELKNIDFTNAVRNDINHKALIESKLIRSKKDTIGYKFYNNLYQISGKFFFEPDLKSYPLDVQKFPISIQANNPADIFLVQPSQKDLRDSVFEAEGWVYENQFLGYDQDIITTMNNLFGMKKNIPNYRFSFVYVMKRAHIDFFLKTLVPLMTIVVITYFSVYIPPREFEALAGVQVTGLLSTIALYFSTYKPAMQYATISDKLFIFMYVMITTLIGTSILIYVVHHKNTNISRLMRIYQRYLFPVIVIAFTVYVRWF